MCWTEFFKTENLIAASSFFVAGASFWVSWLAYKRDSGRLDFYVGLGGIWGGQPFCKQQDVIMFRIINSGRRPLIVSSIGGDVKGEALIRFLAKYWPNRFKPTAYLIQSPQADAALLTNGSPKVLQEGENISFQLPLPEALEIFKKMSTKSDAIYVFDSIGRKHYVSGGAMEKMKADYKNYIAEREVNAR